ncbi:MAG: TIGR01212 family radical SAM protein [Prevotella sp.]|uniref:TIGR01212 family radical SAM protein n=1 Tax=Prevotella sp. P5-92 TaxID=2024222 RepID=UPI000B971385|nr:TIGR01212 family radical SAM protein [Prevotella sp. P5-92]MDD6820532.1 TIGR01212 family radical SAM protein [Prevotella sp.]OYP59736.1 TIGR01212 family radical SAM protein [Prevotella sp. P5-92]
MNYSVSMPYNDYGTWLRQRFPYKVQKISVDAGFTCPNRDGRLGTGGCIYCNNDSFNPSYCQREKSVKQQLVEGKEFFRRKYPEMRYMAYFQAFTNTYSTLDHLKSLYEEALDVEDVVGLVIGTRPDCIDDTLLDYLTQLARQTMVTLEYGIETANDDTLRLIRRGHDFQCVRDAVERTKGRGIVIGGHVILGLPGEDAEESVRQATIMSELGLDVLKIHQMQIIRGTRLAQMYAENPFHLYSPEEYSELIVRYLEHLSEDMVVERFASQSPKEMLIAPKWGLKNYELTNLIVNKMKREGRRQGSLFVSNSLAMSRSL